MIAPSSFVASSSDSIFGTFFTRAYAGDCSALRAALPDSHSDGQRAARMFWEDDDRPLKYSVRLPFKTPILTLIPALLLRKKFTTFRMS